MNNSLSSALIEEDKLDFDNASESSYNVLDTFSFNIFNPGLRWKLKKSFGTLRLGANLHVDNPFHDEAPETTWKFNAQILKNEKRDLRINKIEVSPSKKEITCSVRKIQFFHCIRLKLLLGYNWENGTPFFRYRVMTKWEEACNNVLKYPVNLGNRLRVVPHFEVDYKFPSFGGDSRESEFSLETGHFRLGLPLLDLVTSLDCKATPHSTHGKRFTTMVIEDEVKDIVNKPPQVKGVKNQLSSAVKDFWQKCDKKETEQRSEKTCRMPQFNFSNNQVANAYEYMKSNVLPTPFFKGLCLESKPASNETLPVPFGLQNPLSFPWLDKNGHPKKSQV